MTTLASTGTNPGWFTTEECRLEDFRAVVETTTDLADYPYADEVRENVLVYGARLRNHIATSEGRRDVQAELARANIDIPIIFMTGYADIPMAARAMKAGAVDFLTKPQG